MANKKTDAISASAKIVGNKPKKKPEPQEELQRVPSSGARPPRMWPKDTTPGKKVRYNLTLDEDINDFMRGIVWERRLNISAYVNGLIRADKEAYEAECKKEGKDPYEGWV